MKAEPCRILLAEDDPEMRDLIGEHLESEGHKVVAVGRGVDAVSRLRTEEFDVVLTDLRLPDADGMEVLRIGRESQGDVPVILITAFGTIETAIQAIRQGAYDFVTKPFALDEISLLVSKAGEARRLRDENRRLREQVAERYCLHNLLGKSPGMQRVFSLISQAAPGDTNVLITGESGTGKELVAKALHFNSPRSERAFLPINCAAVPASLLESELFGHVKGAFTGAVGNRRGLFREADGGTLFLDEVADMAPELQAKLLRAIEDRSIRPVGSDQATPLNVRIIAATNQDLAERIRSGKFREDLFYRLAVIPIHLPALRERKEDIPLLAEHFLNRATATTGKPRAVFTPQTMAALLRHSWPGNVRELENVVERAVTLTAGGPIPPDALLLDAALNIPTSASLASLPRRPTLRELSEEYLDLVLQEAGGDKARAAEILGISKRTLYRRDRHTPQEDVSSNGKPL